MKKGRRVSICLGASLVVLAGCGHIVYADGPYRGQVLDAEAKQPIEGAAVLAVWWKRSWGQAHPIITFYDAQEMLTDRDGNFSIPGIVGGSLNPLAMIEQPLFTIFKPGYEAYGDRKLAAPRTGDRTTVELRRLATRNERIQSAAKIPPFTSCLSKELAERLKMLDLAPTSPYCVPEEKFPNLIRLRNVEKRDLGVR